MACSLKRLLRIVFLVVVAICGLSTSALNAQTRTSKFAVDIVNLKSQKQLRGIVVGTLPDTITMIVSAEWYKRFDRLEYEKRIQTAKEESIAAHRKLLERLNDLKLEDLPPALAFFVKQELTRLEKLDENSPSDPPELFRISIKRVAIQSFLGANPAVRSIGWWSWHEKLQDVEMRTALELSKKLQEADIDPTKPPPDLRDRLGTSSDSDDQWTARLAVIRFGLGEQVAFQGAGKMMIRVGDDAPALNIAGLIQDLMQSQTERLLQELLDGPSRSKATQQEKIWCDAAAQQADAASKSYFRATHVDLQLEGERATVTSVFSVRIGNQWKRIWRFQAETIASEVEPDKLRELSQDPQIAGIRDSLDGLGIPLQGLDKAMRFGAATNQALEECNQAFNAFVQPYLKAFDKPGIDWLP